MDSKQNQLVFKSNSIRILSCVNNKNNSEFDMKRDVHFAFLRSIDPGGAKQLGIRRRLTEWHTIQHNSPISDI